MVTIADVSSWQHSNLLDWRKARESRELVKVDGGYFKTSQGVDSRDTYATAHSRELLEAELPAGGYHYATPNNAVIVGVKQDAWREANEFAQALEDNFGFQRNPLKMLPVLDYEQPLANQGSRNRTDRNGLSPEANLEWLQTFFDTMAKRGHPTVMLYSNKYYLDANLPKNHGLTNPLWIAAYNGGASPLLPNGWKTWKLHQYTASGTVAGFLCKVDLSRGIDIPLAVKS